MTHPAARIDVLDGWRGLAIAAVLAGHFVPGLGLDGPFNAGRAGVELFFALSGVLIGRQLLVDRMALPEFAVRRGARILPSMWLFIAVAALLSHNAPSHTLMSALGLANLVWNAEALQHLWSVSLELQGYALLALVALATRRAPRAVLPLLLALVALAWVMVAWAAWRHVDGYYATYWRAPYRLTAMLLGAALAVHFAGGAQPAGPGLAWAAAGLALQAAAVPDALKYTLGSALLAAGVATLAVRPAGAGWLALRPLAWLGVVSYSVYLWQQLVLVQQPTGTVLDAAVALALGALAHHAWDQRLHWRVRDALLARRAGLHTNPDPS